MTAADQLKQQRIRRRLTARKPMATMLPWHETRRGRAWIEQSNREWLRNLKTPWWWV